MEIFTLLPLIIFIKISDGCEISIFAVRDKIYNFNVTVIKPTERCWSFIKKNDLRNPVWTVNIKELNVKNDNNCLNKLVIESKNYIILEKDYEYCSNENSLNFQMDNKKEIRILFKIKFMIQYEQNLIFSIQVSDDYGFSVFSFFLGFAPIIVCITCFIIYFICQVCTIILKI